MNLRENTTYMKVHILDGCNQYTLFQKDENLLLKKNYENATNLIIRDHYLIKGSRVSTLDKLTSTEIYYILVSKVQNKPSSSIYLENLFNKYNNEWKAIYMLPRLITCNTYMQSFQYKILNNVLFHNKTLHTFGIKPSALCCFCTKHFRTYFMNVTLLNIYGWTLPNAFKII